MINNLHNTKKTKFYNLVATQNPEQTERAACIPEVLTLKLTLCSVFSQVPSIVSYRQETLPPKIRHLILHNLGIGNLLQASHKSQLPGHQEPSGSRGSVVQSRH